MVASDKQVAVVRTGTANLASVCAALVRAGCEPVLCDDPERVRRADRVVLPGVGAFAAAMGALGARGLDRALGERVRSGRPTLSICLGLQLLFEGSEESPGVEGLGVIQGRAQAFDPDSGSPLGARLRVPHLGWNRIEPGPGSGLLRPGYAYFAHTYYLERAPTGWGAAWCDYGGRFVAAIERGPVLACQFHPELSGELGRGLIERWLRRGGAAC